MGHLLARGHAGAGQQQAQRFGRRRFAADRLGQAGGAIGPGLGQQGLLLGLAFSFKLSFVCPHEIARWSHTAAAAFTGLPGMDEWRDQRRPHEFTDIQ